MSTLRKNFHLSSPLKIEEESPNSIKKEGIISILESESESEKPMAASFRRTLSAGMSLEKLLPQNGLFATMEKIASPEETVILAQDSSLSSDVKQENEEINESDRPGQDDVWRSIQLEKEKERENLGKLDTWSSILTPKNSEYLSNPQPPYVHPLGKRSTSPLSQKSLEICTESLGSESGSNGFSWNPPSESGDIEEDKEQTQKPEELKEKAWLYNDTEEVRVAKYQHSDCKKSPPRSFPPPVSSISGTNGPSVHVHSHRMNGRLVLQVVLAPTQNYFHAQRQEGRLVLRFANRAQQVNHEEWEENEEEEFENLLDNFEEDIEENEVETDEDEEEVEEEVIEKIYKETMVSSRVTNVHRVALIMKRGNRNPTWYRSGKFNKAKYSIDEEQEEEEDEEATTLPQSLPPQPMVAPPTRSPPAALAASLNVYDYFWRTKPITQKSQTIGFKYKNSINQKVCEQGDLVVLRRNKAGYLVPMLKGCKDPRRSLSVWEPYCIATS